MHVSIVSYLPTSVFNKGLVLVLALAFLYDVRVLLP